MPKRTRAVLETASQVQKYAPGVSRRQLDYWVEKGFVVPRHPGGQGDPRDFSPHELKVLRTIWRLTEAGFPVTIAAEIARRAVLKAVEGKAEVKLSPSTEEDAVVLFIEGI